MTKKREIVPNDYGAKWPRGRDGAPIGFRVCAKCHEEFIIDHQHTGNTVCNDCGEKLIAKAHPDQINPPHYKDGYNGHETWDSALLIYGPEAMKHFADVSAFYYRARAGKKDPDKITEDINKAMWFELKAKELKGERK